MLHISKCSLFIRIRVKISVLYLTGLLLFFISSVGFSQTTLIIDSSPETEIEYKNIFGEMPIGNQLESIKQVNEKYQSLEGFKKTKINNHEKLRNLIESTHHNIIILIGHNSDGMFYFPSGDPIEISEISTWAKEKTITFLSCKAQKYTDSPASRIILNYETAHKIAQEIENRVSDFYKPIKLPPPSNQENSFSFLMPGPITDYPSRKCAALFSEKINKNQVLIKTPLYSNSKAQIQRIIKNTIRKQEISKTLSRKEIIITILTKSGLIFVSISEKSEKKDE